MEAFGELGVKPFVMDAEGPIAALRDTDPVSAEQARLVVVDPTDPAQSITQLQRHGFDPSLPTAVVLNTDWGQKHGHQVARRLGSAHGAGRNGSPAGKRRMLAQATAHGHAGRYLPPSPSVDVASPTSLEHGARQLGLGAEPNGVAAILKEEDGAGGMGNSARLRTIGAVLDAADTMGRQPNFHGQTRCDFILQKIVDGPEISTPVLVVGPLGRPTERPLVIAPFFNEKIVYDQPDGFLESGHIALPYPADFSFGDDASPPATAGLQDALRATLTMAEAQSSLGGGPIQTDVLLEQDGEALRPYVVDTAMRLPGMGITAIGTKVSGIDLAAAQVREAMGAPIPLGAPSAESAAHLSFLGAAQRRKAITLQAAYADLPASPKLTVNPGADPEAGGAPPTELGRDRLNRRFGNNHGSMDIEGPPDAVRNAVFAVAQDDTVPMRPRLR